MCNHSPQVFGIALCVFCSKKFLLFFFFKSVSLSSSLSHAHTHMSQAYLKSLSFFLIFPFFFFFPKLKALLNYFPIKIHQSRL